MIRFRMLLCCLCFGGWLSGQNGVVIGNSEATGESAFATGDSSLAQGFASIAAGSKAKALGDFTLALGDRTTAIGQWSQALGFGSQTDGQYSLGAGFFNYVAPSAPFGVGIGAANVVRGAGGLAIGRDNVSQGDAAIVLGTWSQTHTYGEVVLGAYADTAYTPSTTISSVWEPTDRLFSIANGHGDGAGNGRYSNALTMLKNGDTDMVGNLDVQKSLTVGEDTTQVSFDEGQLRYNNATRDLEGYVQSQWFSLTDVNQPRSEVGSWDFNAQDTSNLKSNGPEIIQFLKIGAIKGEVVTVDYADQIEIFDLQWEVKRSIPQGVTGQQRTQGETSLNRMTLLLPSDLSAEGLADASCQGVFFNEVDITAVAPNGSGQLTERLTYKLKDVIITSFEFYMDNTFEKELVRITLDFTEVEGKVVAINAQGKKTNLPFKYPK